MNKNKNSFGFEPIQINIKDLRAFTEVAYLIDRPSFIREAKKIREEYGIIQPLQERDYRQWLMHNVGEKMIPSFYRDLEDMRHFCQYESHYDTVFELAVLGCSIRDSDYKHTCLISFLKLPYYLKDSDTQNFAILLTPQTDKKDVISAYKRYKKILEELQSSPDTYCYIDRRIDKRSEIERDRKWYWKRVEGKSYWQIAKEEGVSDRETYDSFYKDRIVKAIKSYKDKLL
ncbi:hypothetical protein KJ596_03655 [Patescibacteria group bacterium]|nr:hypothetical protein [Patescibacteria group bacterium]